MTHQEVVSAIIQSGLDNVDLIFFNKSGTKMYFNKITSLGIHYQEVSGYKSVWYTHHFNDLTGVSFVPLGTKDKYKKTYEYKSPKTKARYVGVEIELCSILDVEQMQELIVSKGLEDYVTLKEDGSIDSSKGFQHTHELCLLETEKNIQALVQAVCLMLKENSKVNRSCGLHVHIDMRSRRKEVAYAKLFAAQKLLYSMCPASRADNTYCYPEFAFEGFDAYSDRYKGINVCSYKVHKTIEVRIHSGSLNANKINNWISLLLSIVNTKKKVNEGELWNDLTTVEKHVKLDRKLKRYVVSRLKAFEDKHDEEIRLIA